jgi:NRAMP (natural resistance-associated macrophage protein)-like metal ion transporter
MPTRHQRKGRRDTRHGSGSSPVRSIESELDREPSRLRRFLRILGPGFITGASDDDPSGIGTYATAGALLGFSTLWTALLTLPLMAAVQFLCAKVGMVTGKGIAGVIGEHYSKRVLYATAFTLLVANTVNAGTDIGAIAAAINLLVPVPIAVLIVPVTAIIVAVQVWGSYRLIARTFKWLTLSLLAYVGAALLAKPDLGEVLRGTLFPQVHWNAAYLSTLVAILGTTISPYLFFWQASQEVEEQIAMGRKRLWQRKGATDNELRYAAWDVGIGMFFSNAVMYFIILASAATLFRSGKTDIQTAAEAAQALQPLAGRAAEVLLALGLIGTGFLAVPILTTSSAYALAEALRWRHGLDRKPAEARQFYLLIALSTFAGMLINFLGINPIRALFLTAILNGLLAPPLLVLILSVANNKKIMGNRTSGLAVNALGWATAAVMTAAAVAMLATLGHK